MTVQTGEDARPAAAAAWMLTAQVLFASMATSARIGGQGLPWQEVCAARFAVGLVTVYVAARARGQSLRIVALRAAWLRSSLGTVSAMGTFFLYTTPHLPIGDAATLLATAPVFVAVLGVPILGEPLRAGVVGALVCGFAGIALVARPSFSSGGHIVAIGTSTAIAAALSFILLRRLGSTETSEAVVFHFAWVGTLTMALLCVPVWRTPTPAETLALAVTGLSGGLAQIFMTRAYSLDHAARVAILGYAGMIFTRALALPLFGEVPSGTQAIGSVLVIASGVILALRPSSRAAGGRARAASETG